jgi:nucleoside-diphosphate-sugar epimerase
MTVLLGIGLGFSAKVVASRLKGQGWRIIGTARSEEELESIRALGHEAIAFNGDAPSPELSAAIGQASHVLLSAPPGERGDPVLWHHANDLARASNLVWLGYLSTVGVYGDRGGAWVDETAEPKPISQRSRWRLAAEEEWTRFAKAQHITLQIFRLAGIYGPGRNTVALLKFGRGHRIYKPEQVFNRIHVEDVAAVVEAGIHAGHAAEGIFNVADDEPAPLQETFAFAADLLGVEPPPLIPWEEAGLSPMSLTFFMENKRVRNGRMKDVLGVRLIYPTYREGLRALAAGM